MEKKNDNKLKEELGHQVAQMVECLTLKVEVWG